MLGKKYPFIIWNTDRSDEGGTHLWSILNISPKSELLLFDSFGISCMKHFIVSGNKKVVGKVLKGLELADQKDNKLTPVSSDTQFPKKWKHYKLYERVDAWRPYTKTSNCVTCGPFRLHFYKHLFFPEGKSKLHGYKELTNTALETLLNELFTLNPENNEQTTNQCIKQRQIKMTWPTLTALCQSTILVYARLLTLDRFSLCGEKIKNSDKTDKYFFGKGYITLCKIVLVWLFCHELCTDSNRNFSFVKRCECLIQLEYVVFWTIVNAFVTVQNVKWPLSKYIKLSSSIVKCKVFVYL